MSLSTRVMPLDIRPGEQYTIKRKTLVLLGAKFYVFGPAGQVVGFCKQKAFRLRESFTIFTDESMSSPLLTMQARSIIDFGATYDIAGADGRVLGSVRRRGLTSTFGQDSWMIFSPDGRQIGAMTEDNLGMALARKWLPLVALFSPQQFAVTGSGGQQIAAMRQHFNLFSYRLSVSVMADDPNLPDGLILALGVLVAAIEGRQDNS
jgi:uncharacterized protein YxjI